MRSALLRVTMLAAGWVIAILVIPLTLVRIIALTAPELDVAGLVEPLRGPRGAVLVIAVAVVQVVLALLLARFIATRQSRHLTEPMTALAKRAELLGAGHSRLQPMDSGIPEIDRVSDVLARSSANLARQLAEQRDFAADASHQLRTPLTALLMRLDEIATTDDLQAAHQEATIAISQVERLTKVVDELLSRSKSEQTAVSLDSILAALQREWQPAFARARRTVRVHGERGLYVQATSSAVSQIISTLFENSLQHGRGTVDVQARRSGPSVVLQVSDRGEGVPAEIAGQIFEREVSSSGSGLGLSLARDLAAANGGRLELLSARPAVFALFLSEAGIPEG